MAPVIYDDFGFLGTRVAVGFGFGFPFLAAVAVVVAAGVAVVATDADANRSGTVFVDAKMTSAKATRMNATFTGGYGSNDAPRRPGRWFRFARKM